MATVPTGADWQQNEYDKSIVARARQLGPSLRASDSDRDRLAGWLLKELIAQVERLGGDDA